MPKIRCSCNWLSEEAFEKAANELAEEGHEKLRKCDIYARASGGKKQKCDGCAPVLEGIKQKTQKRNIPALLAS